MKNLIELQPTRNFVQQFELNVWVSLKAKPWALMSPSPAPKVNPASPCGRVAGRMRCVFS